MPTWEELCDDPALADLPYKIETNRHGQIIMSPTRYYLGGHTARIAILLEQLMGSGEVIVECSVQTTDGVKEADVAWLTDELADQMQDVAACPVAPQICAEVISPSNSPEQMVTKRELYFAAGAVEYWTCDRAGNMRFYSATGELAQSGLCPEFPAILPKRRRNL
jgi:Uma2 family endonuclease